MGRFSEKVLDHGTHGCGAIVAQEEYSLPDGNYGISRPTGRKLIYSFNSRGGGSDLVLRRKEIGVIGKDGFYHPHDKPNSMNAVPAVLRDKLSPEDRISVEVSEQNEEIFAFFRSEEGRRFGKDLIQAYFENAIAGAITRRLVKQSPHLTHSLESQG